MTESHEASTDITLIRRELRRLRHDVKQVGDHVKEVDAKVERSRVTDLAALAVSLARETGDDPVLIMIDAGMRREDVCMATGLTPGTLRQRISRARRNQTKPKKKDKG
jgi:hypothetical protein